MTIEKALEIIENTNFYASFTNTEQDEAFDMAIGALLLFQVYKRELKELERTKGNFLAHVIASTYRKDIEILEGSCNNGD